MGSHWLIHSNQSSMRFVPPYPERILGVGDERNIALLHFTPAGGGVALSSLS
jgi:hypothetical protein